MLNKKLLKSQIKEIFGGLSNVPPDQVLEVLSEKLSTAIDDYVKSATITITPSTIVVVGSATTQTNASPIVVDKSIT